MKRCLITVALAAAISGRVNVSDVLAADPPPSKAQEILNQAAEEQKYAFVCFFREDSAEARAMAQVLKSGVASRPTQTALCFVRISDPAEQAVVQRFGVARTPMPLTLAVAPNGAITGVFSRKLADANLTSAIVTPTMAECMKSMQSGKLVFVCVHASPEGVTPAAVQEFGVDPAFKDRLAVYSVQRADPAEAAFFKQMRIDPDTVSSTTTVVLAPPGVLIGRFAAAVGKAQIAEALHKAGKCCDDPNCKHGHGTSTQPTTSGARKVPSNGSTPR